MAEKEQKDNLEGLKSFIHDLLSHNFPPKFKEGDIVWYEDYRWLEEQGLYPDAKFVVKYIFANIDLDDKIGWKYTIVLHNNPFKYKQINKISIEVYEHRLRLVNDKNIEE